MFVLAVLSLAWKDWERKASNFPPEVAFHRRWIGGKYGNKPMHVLRERPNGNNLTEIEELSLKLLI